MHSILIGVDESDRSKDAVAFGRRLASVSPAQVIVACAFPYSDWRAGSDDPRREGLRNAARATVHSTSQRLEGIAADRVEVRIVANPSPAHALHDVAESERAGIIIVGSSHTGRLGRVSPGSTGERLLHGAPCAVAVAPHGFHTHAEAPFRRIGVAYDASDEATAAVAGALFLARAFDAELEIIGIVAPAATSMGGPAYADISEAVERSVQEDLDTLIAELPADVTVTGVRLAGDPAGLLAERSAGVDLMLMGSRGYGPLRSVLVGGVSGQVTRTAHCPVIVVPRGADSPLGTVFNHPLAAPVRS